LVLGKALAFRDSRGTTAETSIRTRRSGELSGNILLSFFQNSNKVNKVLKKLPNYRYVFLAPDKLITKTTGIADGFINYNQDVICTLSKMKYSLFVFLASPRAFLVDTFKRCVSLLCCLFFHNRRFFFGGAGLFFADQPRFLAGFGAFSSGFFTAFSRAGIAVESRFSVSKQLLARKLCIKGVY
jgi:hypothetical protein